MVYAVTLLGSGLLVGLWLGGRPAKSAVASNRTTPPLTVSVVTAERKSLADAVSVVGATRSRENVRVVPELPGLQVQRVAAEVGDYVKAGQVLAVLDPKGTDIARDELRSEFERARGEYERLRTLLPQQLISVEFFKQKQAAYEVARSRYENAQLSVRRTQVIAPAAGLVYRRNASIGELTSADTPLYEIAKDGEVEMDASVPEALVGRLRPGMAASVRVAGRAEPIAGEIRLIAPNVDSASRASEVRIRLDAQGALPVGAFAQARIELAQVQGWTVPHTAIQQDSSGRYLWRVGDRGRVARMAVTPTLQTADTVVVAEALDGVRVVAKAGPFLRENDQVLVADARR